MTLSTFYMCALKLLAGTEEPKRKMVSCCKFWIFNSQWPATVIFEVNDELHVV